MPYDQNSGDYFDRKIEFEDLNSIYAQTPSYEQTTDLERFATFNPGFSSPTHDLSPITTREEFATEQLKNSLAQAAFWLGLAHSWATELEQDEEFSTDLADAIHYTGMAQLKGLK